MWHHHSRWLTITEVNEEEPSRTASVYGCSGATWRNRWNNMGVKVVIISGRCKSSPRRFSKRNTNPIHIGCRPVSHIGSSQLDASHTPYVTYRSVLMAEIHTIPVSSDSSVHTYGRGSMDSFNGIAPTASKEQTKQACERPKRILDNPHPFISYPYYAAVQATLLFLVLALTG